MSAQSQDPKMDIGQPETPTQSRSQKSRRRFWIMAGGAVLVIVLVGAAYLAGNLMSSGESLPGNHSREVIPASELPNTQPDVFGLFLSRSNDTFIIGTGNIRFNVPPVPGGSDPGSVTPGASYDGPTYEVVVNKDTVIYKDTTQIEPNSSGQIQQTVDLGTLDDLNSMTVISVWGKRTGDRYVANVIFYQPPTAKVLGGSGGTKK